jgi:hypothetical protein
VVEVEHYFNREDGFSLSWAWKPLFMTWKYGDTLKPKN